MNKQNQIVGIKRSSSAVLSIVAALTLIGEAPKEVDAYCFVCNPDADFAMIISQGPWCLDNNPIGAYVCELVWPAGNPWAVQGAF